MLSLYAFQTSALETSLCAGLVFPLVPYHPCHLVSYHYLVSFPSGCSSRRCCRRSCLGWFLRALLPGPRRETPQPFSPVPSGGKRGEVPFQELLKLLENCSHICQKDWWCKANQKASASCPRWEIWYSAFWFGQSASPPDPWNHGREAVAIGGLQREILPTWIRMPICWLNSTQNSWMFNERRWSGRGGRSEKHCGWKTSCSMSSV